MVPPQAAGDLLVFPPLVRDVFWPLLLWKAKYSLFRSVQSQNTDPLKSKQQLDLERARFLVTQAFDEDDKGNAEEAVELYTEAVELCLKTVC